MQYIKVARADDIQEGKVTLVDGKVGQIGLTKVNGKIIAYLDLCTHVDKPLDPNSLEGETIECPHHGAKFNVRTGEALNPPATEDLEIFPVRISGEMVEVGIE